MQLGFLAFFLFGEYAGAVPGALEPVSTRPPSKAPANSTAGEGSGGKSACQHFVAFLKQGIRSTGYIDRPEVSQFTSSTQPHRRQATPRRPSALRLRLV